VMMTMIIMMMIIVSISANFSRLMSSSGKWRPKNVTAGRLEQYIVVAQRLDFTSQQFHFIHFRLSMSSHMFGQLHYSNKRHMINFTLVCFILILLL
jgi:hypothetical protein